MSIWMILRGRSVGGSRRDQSSRIFRIRVEAGKASLAAIDAIDAIHTRATDGEPTSKLPEGQSGPVLLDQGLPIKIASPITGIAFDGNYGVPIVSQCCVIAGIFSHL